MDNKDYRLPKRKDGLETFQRILDTAKVLFAKNGYSNTSINEIIEKSKIATGTFYLYFDDKLALYKYLLNSYGKKIKQYIRISLKDVHDRYEQEKYGIKAFLRFSKDDPLSYRIIWESMFIDFNLFKQYYKDFAARYVHNLKESRALGEIRSDIDLETTAYMLMGISNFVGLQIMFENPETINEDRLEEIAIHIMKILREGMFAKGLIIRK